MNGAYEDNFEQSRHRACFLETLRNFKEHWQKKHNRTLTKKAEQS